MWSINAGLGEASPAELARACEAIAAELAARPAPESGLAALEVAESVSRAIDLAEAAMAVLVAKVDVSGAHGEHGFPSAVSWLRERTGMRHGRAAERITLARQLPRLERVRKLLSGGELSLGYASAVCAAVPRLDDEDAVVAEEILLGLVEEGCAVGQVAKAGERITDLVAERLGRESEPGDGKRGFARSWMVRSKSLDGGSWFKGWCTAEHTAALDQIVGPLAKPRAQGDDRDIAQRTADALFSVLTGGNRGAGVTLIIDLAAYTAATGDTGPFTHTPRTGDAPDPPTGQACDAAPGHAAGPCPAEPDNLQHPAAQSRPPRRAARLLDGTPISPQDARRIALNAGINPLILGREGLPIYLGRTTRFASPAQRKTLLALYDSCGIIGCRIPAHLCEIHHLGGGWKLGTPTDIDRLIPLCGWHNRWIESHEDQITEVRDTRGRTTLEIRPPWSARRTTHDPPPGSIGHPPSGADRSRTGRRRRDQR